MKVYKVIGYIETDDSFEPSDDELVDTLWGALDAELSRGQVTYLAVLPEEEE